jgi:hypothetical protein
MASETISLDAGRRAVLALATRLFSPARYVGRLRFEGLPVGQVHIDALPIDAAANASTALSVGMHTIDLVHEDGSVERREVEVLFDRDVVVRFEAGAPPVNAALSLAPLVASAIIGLGGFAVAAAVPLADLLDPNAGARALERRALDLAITEENALPRAEDPSGGGFAGYGPTTSGSFRAATIAVALDRREQLREVDALNGIAIGGGIAFGVLGTAAVGTLAYLRFTAPPIPPPAPRVWRIFSSGGDDDEGARP